MKEKPDVQDSVDIYDRNFLDSSTFTVTHTAKAVRD